MKLGSAWNGSHADVQQTFLARYSGPQQRKPNGPVTADAGTYTFSAAKRHARKFRNFVTARMDYQFAEKDAIHGAYLFDQAATAGQAVYNGLLLGIFARRQTTSAEAGPLRNQITRSLLQAAHLARCLRADWYCCFAIVPQLREFFVCYASFGVFTRAYKCTSQS